MKGFDIPAHIDNCVEVILIVGTPWCEFLRQVVESDSVFVY